jgi:hypothetical protein
MVNDLQKVSQIAFAKLKNVKSAAKNADNDM